MNIDVYSSTGDKKGTVDLPSSLFEQKINEGLMHQYLLYQESHRRGSIAHTKTRGDIRGSTRKMYAQKGTGRARRGSKRSPLLRGGSKAFGPKNVRNYSLDMPREMRRTALRSCLSSIAKMGTIVGIEDLPQTTKTKDIAALLTKIPRGDARPLLFVLPERMPDFTRALSNLEGTKTVLVQYLNPEDLLKSRGVLFHVRSIEKAEILFAKKSQNSSGDTGGVPKKPTKSTAPKTSSSSKKKKAPARKKAPAASSQSS